MMRRAKSDESALWHEAMRGVKPLRANRAARRKAHGEAAQAEESAESFVQLVDQSLPVPNRTAKARATSAPRQGLDRRTAQRLKRGQTAIEARLDLHGMTQDEAHAALDRFIAAALASGKRNLLVITGKSGVLHGLVPRWLEDGANRARVLAFAQAHAPHGGAGALYVLLRRPR